MICFNPNMFRMMDAGGSDTGTPEAGSADTGSSADTAAPTDGGGG